MSSKKQQQKREDAEPLSSGDKYRDYLLITLASLCVLFLAAVVALWLKPPSQVIVERLVVQEEQKQPIKIVEEIPRLRYWSVVLVKWHDRGHVRTMDRVFERLQYKFVNASHGDEWDILWSIEQPFMKDPEDDQTLFANFTDKPLRQEQKVNHFPGIAALVSKSFMNEVNQDLPYILPSFVMPDDRERLNTFLEANPGVKLVEKNYYNRGVQIVTQDDILEDESEFFYQQFMDNHLLIDGHAFDFGVFVLITSFDPLRVYRYQGDVLFRFCVKKYHPFDPNDTDRYVVQRNCHNAYDMPLFEKTYQRFGYPFIRIFEKYVEDKGHDIGKFWAKVDDAITNIVLNTESYVIKALEKRGLSGHNLFELVRFDFIIDNDLNPYVMEVNMSPNLTPAAKRYEENCNLYEPLIYNVVHMIGGGSYYEFHARFNDSDIVVGNHKDIAVDIDACIEHECHLDCSHEKCKVCLSCVSAKTHFQMREAFREHTHEGHFKRVFPAEPHFYDENFIKNMTDNNQVSIAWFRAQCEVNEKWCA